VLSEDEMKVSVVGKAPRQALRGIKDALRGKGPTRKSVVKTGEEP